MPNDIVLPGDKQAEAIAETARFGQGLTTLVQTSGEWASAVLGTLPHDVVGIIGDEVRAYRFQRAVFLRDKVVEKLRRSGYDAPEQLSASPSLLLPALRAAIEENRTPIQNLWINLIASASAPDTRDRVRKSFITIVESLDPPDALVLQYAPQWMAKFDYIGHVASVCSIDRDDATISISRLAELKLLIQAGNPTRNDAIEVSGYRLTALGASFLRAVGD